MKFNSSYLVAVLAGVMLAGFLPHKEWVVGWSAILAMIVTAIASARDETWTRGLDWLFKP